VGAVCQRDASGLDTHRDSVRVRVEIMGSQNCRIVGKSQPFLIVIHPITFTRTRNRPFWDAGAHLQQLKLNGLWVTLPNGDSFVVQEGPFVSFIDGANTQDLGEQDYVLLTLRADQLAESAAAIVPLLG
jgi:hypothetical protein